MRILFIHNNNLPVPIRHFIYEEQPLSHSLKVIPISQDTSDKDNYDTFLDKTLLSSLKEEYDLIVLPLTLSDSNPLEFTGIRCAAHIRLDKRYKNTCTPILFLGPDSLDNILRLSELGSFILTPSVFLSNANTTHQFDEWLEDNTPIIKRLSKTDYNRFLKRFVVKAPSNFADNHHSIANLWGASVLCHRITKEAMPSTAGNSEALRSLFFKYVITKKDIFESDNRRGPNETETLALGKSFLLIDDEADKGWSFALDHYLKGSKQFDVISEKIQNYEDFSEKSRTKIEKGNYDIIFLDLRLNGPEEEEVVEPNIFSGMTVLRRIKEINRGTQVTMFTASDKAWNLKALLDAGADGYYIKQSPEYYTENSIENNFLSLKDSIRYCLNRAYLKDIYPKMKDLNEICKRAIDPEFSDPISKYFDLSFTLLSSATNKAQYSYAFLALFGVLEEITKYYILPAKKDERLYYFDKDPVHLWDINEQGIAYHKSSVAIKDKTSFTQKILAIYHDCLNIEIVSDEAKRLDNLVKRRNNFVHNDEASLRFADIDTPELGNRHAFLDLFEVVDMMIRDCFN